MNCCQVNTLGRVAVISKSQLGNKSLADFFMQLTQRQCETIHHLKLAGITGNDNIINWAKKKLQQPRYSGRKGESKKNLRTHSVEYYQEIISYFESNGSSIEQLDR